jgi:3-keto-L-gulonate-6-phosphate decarboxylase
LTASVAGGVRVDVLRLVEDAVERVEVVIVGRAVPLRADQLAR